MGLGYVKEFFELFVIVKIKAKLVHNSGMGI